MAAPTSFGKPLVRATIVALVALALAISGREAQAQSLSAALRIPSPDKGVAFGASLAGSANKIAVGGGFIGGSGGVIVYDAHGGRHPDRARRTRRTIRAIASGPPSPGSVTTCWSGRRSPTSTASTGASAYHLRRRRPARCSTR